MALAGSSYARVVSVSAPDARKYNAISAPAFELIGEVRTASPVPKSITCCSLTISTRESSQSQVWYVRLANQLPGRGLPLLKAIGRTSFRAVIARVRSPSVSMVGSQGDLSPSRKLESDSHTFRATASVRFIVFDLFINWYGPYFDAYSFVLARAQEYKADRYAAKIAGKAVAVRALLQMEGKLRAFQKTCGQILSAGTCSAGTARESVWVDAR